MPVLRPVLAVLALVAVLAAAPAAAEPWLLDAPGARPLGPAELAAAPPRFPFPPGERLEYEVRWFGMLAGTATAEVARLFELDGRRYAHVVATARSSPLLSALYPVDDRSEAWIDADRFVTVRTRTVTRRRDKHYVETVDYDWDTHYVSMRLDKLHKRQRREIAFDFGPFVRDTFDLVYAMRALPLGPGFRARQPTYAARRIYEFAVEVEAAPPVESRALGAAVPVLAVRPSTWLDGRLFGAGSGTVWVSPRAAWAPVRMHGWIRTEATRFLVRGLALELVRYDAHAPGFAPASLPALPAVEAEVPNPALRAGSGGRPRWEPPAPLAALRSARGVVPRDLRLAMPPDVAAP